ncbi:hypothetical protein V7x_31600 [Crateriforma conspicua]|uniref:Uncharacterized protein n=1 Tax=Crateriforma conspicua TaxID=2527996 RepID=A0A5C6G124_9PLAN|nr:hypothetical protein V7x_31600 [Crateriforma conspicua]
MPFRSAVPIVAPVDRPRSSTYGRQATGHPQQIGAPAVAHRRPQRQQLCHLGIACDAGGCAPQCAPGSNRAGPFGTGFPANRRVNRRPLKTPVGCTPSPAASPPPMPRLRIPPTVAPPDSDGAVAENERPAY